MTPLEDRLANYKLRMAGEALSPAAERVLTPTAPISSESMNAYFNATSSWFAFEVLIRGLLNAVEGGVPITVYPFYLSFGRELWQLQCMRGIPAASPAGAQEAAIGVEKWVARGLDKATLDAIVSLFGTTGGLSGPVPESPPDMEGVRNPVTLEVTAVEGAQLYWFRVINEMGGQVRQKADSGTPTWLVAPELGEERVYRWDAAVKVGGLWSPFFSPRWSFFVMPPA